VATTTIMATGCKPQPPSTRATMPKFSGSRIPRSQYRSTDAMRRFVPLGKCQSSVPACCEYATIKCYQTKYGIVTGQSYPELSFCGNYQEQTGGDFTAGDMPLHAIKSLAEKGAYPVVPGLPEWFDRPMQIPAQAASKRHLFRADEWEECADEDDVVSAALNMDPVNVGIDWFDTDVNPGPTGHLQVQGNRLLGGHSLIVCGVVMGYRYSPSGIGLLFGNHHGDSKTPAMHDERGNTFKFPVWGDDGFGVMPIERIRDGIGKYGSFALRSIYLPDADLAGGPDPKFPDSATAAA
jgi:hypothetical protein